MRQVFKQGKLYKAIADQHPTSPVAAAPYKASRTATQDVHAVQIPEALLKLRTVEAVTGISGSSIYRKLKAGDFPAPIKDGLRCTRWRAKDVTAWLRSRGEVLAA